MVIAPEVSVTPDRPVVRFREPRDKLNLAKELQRVVQMQGWGVGTYFNVQFVSHNRENLLAECAFLVTCDAEELKTNDENPYSPKTHTAHIKTIKQISPFLEFDKDDQPEQGDDRVAALESMVAELHKSVERLSKPKRGRPAKEE